MKEILFRGKTNAGKWVYGSLILAGSYCCILESIDGEATPVIPETVSQYTGLKDKNGKKIFEGDILKTRKDAMHTEKLKGYFGYDSEGYPQKIPGYTGESEYQYNTQVDCYAEVVSDSRSGYYLSGSSMFVDAICNEVVGNIHDNPELLEVKYEL